MIDYDLQTLRLFVLTAEERNLSRAADRMRIAISAASRRIRLLEQGVGSSLFRRMAHGVEPTENGLTMLHYAREVLRLSDQLGANIADRSSGITGRVRVFASSSALVQRLASDLSAFSQKHPLIKLDLEEMPTPSTVEALQRNQAQLGVLVRGFSTGSMTTFPYITDRLVLAVPRDHAFATRGSVRLQEILNEDLVSLDAGTATHRLLAEQARDVGLFPKHRVQVRSFEVMCQMVSHHLGIGILPELAVTPLAQSLGLAVVELDEPWAQRHLDICVPDIQTIEPPTQKLLDVLLERTRATDFQ